MFVFSPTSSRRLARLALLMLILASPAGWADSVGVEIEGVKGKLADNVSAFLSIAAEHENEWSASHIARLHRRARGEILSALQPFGYYQPVITTALDAEGDEWAARYTIDKGPPTRVEKLRLQARGEGANEPSVQKALNASKLAPGKRLVHSQYSTTKTALIQAAYDNGYLDAAYKESEIRVTAEANRAEIALVLETGQRYYFGPVSIEQDILKPEFAQRHVPFEPGAPFNTSRLNELQLALTDTGYFSQVEIEADRKRIAEQPLEKKGRNDIALSRMFFRRLSGPPAPRRPHLPITVRTQPSKPQKYSASAGYGTDTGPRVGLGVELRRLNKRGHKFRSDLQLSVVKQALSARYIIPIDEVSTDQLTFGATAKSEEFGGAVSNSFILSSSIEDGWRWGRRRVYLSAERENFDFGEGSSTSDLLYPGLTLSFKRADDALRTRRGISLSGDIHGGTESIFSSTDFLQLKFNGASVLPLGPRSRLLLRGELGAIETSDFSQLPPSQRFFTGGDRSVRGYSYQTISPVNGDNDDIGGRYLAVASVEVDRLIYKNYGAALFFDAGDAANTTSLKLKRGVGIGLRWLSPVGMVRLDFAHPLDDPDSDFAFHFSLGPDL